MEVNHRTAARIRFLPEMRTEAQQGLHRIEEKGREREREGEAENCPYDMRTTLKKGDADLF